MLAVAQYFLEAATVDPISLALLVIGNVLIVGIMALAGYLTVGGLVGALSHP